MKDSHMANKDLKKMSRAELLELLLIQTRTVEQLQKKLAKAEALLADRQLRIEKAGSLAEAMVDINGVMEAAQAAADQYLENIAAMREETRKQCDQMLREARAEAERIAKSKI